MIRFSFFLLVLILTACTGRSNPPLSATGKIMQKDVELSECYNDNLVLQSELVELKQQNQVYYAKYIMSTYKVTKLKDSILSLNTLLLQQ